MNSPKHYKSFLLSLLLLTTTLLSKQISIIGCGPVGLCLASVLVRNGHAVTCVDMDIQKVSSLTSQKLPFYEPSLQELLFNQHNNVLFSCNLNTTADIYYICVQTPNDAHENCDLSFLYAAFSNLLQKLTLPDPKIVCIKSTVPPGTMRTLQTILSQEHKGHIQLIYNPEFMREGSAIDDISTNNPVVLGGESCEALQAIENLYTELLGNRATIVKTSFETAELIKYAWNSFSATRITFVNELAYLCRLYNADIEAVTWGMSLSEKLLPTETIKPGPGYGGSCLPKDTNTFTKIMQEKGFTSSIVGQTVQSNKEHKKRIIADIFSSLDPRSGQHTVALLGLSFKENTDDCTNAPSRDIIQALLDNNIIVHAYDPKASESIKESFPTIHYFSSPYDAVTNADCIVVLTPWEEIKHMDLGKVATLCNKQTIIDTKNIWSPEQLQKHDFIYLNLGLPKKNNGGI